MICDKCGKREANMHVSQVINGVKYEQHLCSECAGTETPLANFGGMLQGFNMQDMMRSLYQMSGGGQQMMPAAGTALPEQSDCSHLEELGLKLPDFTEEAREPATEAEQDEGQKLRAQLNEAVENEEYERAARLKKQIEALGE